MNDELFLFNLHTFEIVTDWVVTSYPRPGFQKKCHVKICFI